MRFRPCGTLIALLTVVAPAFGQTASTPLPPVAATTPHGPRAAPVRRPQAPRKPGARSGSPGGGAWIKLNTHILNSIGESTWVNLAQAANIRFYQAGKTTFAAVGVGGTNFVSTSDPAEIRRLRAYVTTHQMR